MIIRRDAQRVLDAVVSRLFAEGLNTVEIGLKLSLPEAKAAAILHAKRERDYAAKRNRVAS